MYVSGDTMRTTLFLVTIAAMCAALLLTASREGEAQTSLATFYGLFPDAHEGAAVTAIIGNTVCGHGQVIEDDAGGLVYVVDVEPESLVQGCGRTGLLVRFYVGTSAQTYGYFAAESGFWRSGAIELDLSVGTVLRHYIFTPGMRSSGGAVPPAASPTPMPSPTPRPQPTGNHCVVSNVVDGDTIDVSGCADSGRVRLILVDTPEVFGGVQCYGREASAYTEQWLLGKTVTLEKDVSETDRFGRLLRYVWVDGLLFNEQIVRDGYAVLSTFPPDVKHVERIRAAQQEAYLNDRGLWGSCGGVDVPAPPTPPVAPTSPTQPFATATPTRTPPSPGGGGCSPSYPDVCIPPAPPDLNCGDIPYRNFRVLPPDPHRFDGDRDGWGCES